MYDRVNFNIFLLISLLQLEVVGTIEHGIISWDRYTIYWHVNWYAKEM